MVDFQGDLLMGGTAVRNVRGVFESEKWTGQFALPGDRTGSFELGRPYLLLLDDGRSGRVTLTEVRLSSDQALSIVEFEAI